MSFVRTPCIRPAASLGCDRKQSSRRGSRPVEGAFGWRNRSGNGGRGQETTMSFGASPGASTLHPVAPLHAEQLWGAIVIAIMLVESTSLLRGALAAVLSTEADLDVVAELGRIDKAVPVARAVHPDVVVVGADLLDDDGISTLEELHREVPTCAVIVLVDVGAPGAVRAEREPYVRGFIGRDTAP